MRLLLGALCILSAAATTAPTTHPDAVIVGGRVERPGEWTVARLREELKSDLRPVTYTVKGARHQSECVSLDAVLKASQIKVNTARKSHVLAMVVSVSAGDGYTASFSIGELSPEVGNHPVWLALDIDGGPLPDRDGPVKLVVPDDKKASRWVYGISSITVVDPTAAP